MAAIMAGSLVKRFGQNVAVDGISFNVEKGEFFGLLGPNGAGKTTTIRMLTGVLKPDAGNVSIMEMDLAKNPLEAKEKMGVIPEVGTVYPDLSARENLELVGRFYGLRKENRQARAEQLLTELGLKERADDLIKKYSKGMKQRVSIACAMIHEPPVLFLDEPTEGLDVQSRRLIVEKVKQLNKKGSAVLLTTHNIEEASRMCEKVCIINKGKVVVIDSPERLRQTFEKVQSVEVSFDRKMSCEAFPKFPCVTKMEEAGDKIRLFTADPDETVREVMRYREEHDLKIISLATIGPSLEDVFVKLTEGRK